MFAVQSPMEYFTLNIFKSIFITFELNFLCLHAMVHTWRSEDNLWESVLSFDHSPVCQLDSRCLYPLSHLPGPYLSVYHECKMQACVCVGGVCVWSELYRSKFSPSIM